MSEPVANLPPSIVAPVDSLEGAKEVLQAGACELYCGILPDLWIDKFGQGDLLTRRQGKHAHFSDFAQLEKLLVLADAFHASVALTLNVRYSHVCEKMVGKIAEQWEQIGGKRIIVCDIGLLLALERAGSGLRRHLSLMANVYNGSSVKFFRQLGVKRVILPRHLSFAEISEITSACPDMEYEILVMNQKCPFMDGFCGFYHDQCLAHDVPVDFDYEHGAAGQIVRSLDVDYEGHGCRLPWQDRQGRPIRCLGDVSTAEPVCGACDLNELSRLGIDFLKIAGRGVDSGYIADTVKFLGKACTMDCTDHIRQLYADIFSVPCRPRSCYFTDSQRKTASGYEGK